MNLIIVYNYKLEEIDMKIIEGYMFFKGFKMYYCIVGENMEGKKLLVLFYGGLGFIYNYFEVLDKIVESGR